MLRLAMSTAKNTDAQKALEKLSFEDGLKRLESLVEAMESEDLPLETLLAKFEEGSQLARACQTKLAEAEVRIQQLEKNAAGELSLKPLSLDAPPPES